MSAGSANPQSAHDFGINGNKEDFDKMDRLQRIQSVEPEQFEKFFLAPQNRVAGEFNESCCQPRIIEQRLTASQGQLRKTFANPTPVALAGFLLCDSTAAIDIMGWGGAGGNAVEPMQVTGKSYRTLSIAHGAEHAQDFPVLGPPSAGSWWHRRVQSRQLLSMCCLLHLVSQVVWASEAYSH